MRIRLQFCSALKQVSFRTKWSSLPGSMGTTSISPDDGSLWSAGISERGDLSNKNRKLWRVLALKDEFKYNGDLSGIQTVVTCLDEKERERYRG